MLIKYCFKLKLKTTLAIAKRRAQAKACPIYENKKFGRSLNMTNIYYDYELLQNYRVFVNKLSDIIKSGNKEGFEL